ncbi:hypothetical protein JAAARDRAFT_52168 [Jaapia argillacea MUCL 33604]|uniref:Uncharacterized protein n=1 Tax=Jaapia argillacea MUCL 33604 TaxID=933084 RepID=A0A067QB40_9AGAM|nr:hypothetical protein JAAARDRAFT_52168 [Jaapia argillacea MUCL 33604]
MKSLQVVEGYVYVRTVHMNHVSTLSSHLSTEGHSLLFLPNNVLAINIPFCLSAHHRDDESLYDPTHRRAVPTLTSQTKLSFASHHNRSLRLPSVNLCARF